MNLDDTELLPWGVVDPAFWQTAPAEPDHGGAQHTDTASTTPTTSTATDTVPVTADTAADQGSGEAGAPAEYGPQIARITAAFADPENRTELEAAAVEAALLDAQLTARYGERHPHTVNARELRGWLALLAGDPSTAARWYLHTAASNAALAGPTAPATIASTQRAVHCWSRVTDVDTLLETGPSLASLVASALGPDDGTARYVSTRLAGHASGSPNVTKGAASRE
ncbi:hypothetical protein [Streptomyces sp. NPDC058623]|uniref:hypothetical protein n=1 Tax=Streptomyces sp. NPDC058623 TaxID=3346563 RepID=UPI003660927E